MSSHGGFGDAVRRHDFREEGVEVKQDSKEVKEESKVKVNEERL